MIVYSTRRSPLYFSTRREMPFRPLVKRSAVPRGENLAKISDARTRDLPSKYRYPFLVKAVTSELRKRLDTCPDDACTAAVEALQDPECRSGSEYFLLNAVRTHTTEAARSLVRELRNPASMKTVGPLVRKACDHYPVIVIRMLVRALSDGGSAAGAFSVLERISEKYPALVANSLVGALADEKSAGAASKLLYLISMDDFETSRNPLVAALSNDATSRRARNILLDVGISEPNKVASYLVRFLCRKQALENIRRVLVDISMLSDSHLLSVSKYLAGMTAFDEEKEIVRSIFLELGRTGEESPEGVMFHRYDIAIQPLGGALSNNDCRENASVILKDIGDRAPRAVVRFMRYLLRKENTPEMIRTINEIISEVCRRTGWVENL